MGDLDVDVQTNTLFRIGNIPNPIQIRVRGKTPTCIKVATDIVDRTIKDEIELIAAIQGYRQVRSQLEHRLPHET